MTVAIGTTTLTTTEVGMLMGAHVDLGLSTSALGDLYFGYDTDAAELRAELEAISARGTSEEKEVAEKALHGLT